MEKTKKLMLLKYGTVVGIVIGFIGLIIGLTALSQHFKPFIYKRAVQRFTVEHNLAFAKAIELEELKLSDLSVTAFKLKTQGTAVTLFLLPVMTNAGPDTAVFALEKGVLQYEGTFSKDKAAAVSDAAIAVMEKKLLRFVKEAAE